MKQAIWPGRQQRFQRRAVLIAIVLGAGLVAAACGRPREATTPTGAAVPAGYAGQSGIPTALPPSLTRTPFPTVAATYAVTPVVPDPNPPGKPTPAQTLRDGPTPRPEDPYNVISYPLHY